MKKSSTSSANRAARLVRTSLPQYQHFLVQQNSEAIHEVLSQNRALSLQDHHNLIPMNKLHLTRGWGEVMFICLHAQSFAIMHISYMLLHLHVGSVVNTSTGNTNISAATLLQTALCYGSHATTGRHLQMASLPFQEPLTAGLGLFPHNHVSNCQQEAILKSHLSKILCTYGSEVNIFPESGERSLARAFKMGSFWWGLWFLKAWQAAIQPRLWFLLSKLNLNARLITS